MDLSLTAAGEIPSLRPMSEEDLSPARQRLIDNEFRKEREDDDSEDDDREDDDRTGSKSGRLGSQFQEADQMDDALRSRMIHRSNCLLVVGWFHHTP